MTKNKKQKRKALKVRPYKLKNPLYKTIKPLSIKSKVICTDTLTIQANAASAVINFSSGTQYYDFKNLFNLVDFTDASSSYRCFKLHGVSLEIIRTVDEATILANTRGFSTFIGYYPDLYSTVVSHATLSKNQLFYNVDPMTFDKQYVNCPSVDMDYLASNGGDIVTLNNSKIMPISSASVLGGQINIACGNSTVNAATLNLFSVLIKFHCTFYFRN